MTFMKTPPSSTTTFVVVQCFLNLSNSEKKRVIPSYYRGTLLLATDSRQETYVPDYPIYRLSISSKPFLSPDGILSSILPVLSSSSLFAHQLSLFFYYAYCMSVVCPFGRTKVPTRSGKKILLQKIK